MEEKINGFVISSVDYKENDKVLTIYSLEKGKITAGIKGVKKANAKLKFCAEPFCFAEYIINVKSGRNTVINASYIDSFYNIRTSMKKYYAASVIQELMNKLTEENDSDNVFDLAINSIKDICYKDNEKYALAKFVLGFMDYLGYSIGNPLCYGCGKKIENEVLYNFEDEIFSCKECGSIKFKKIKIETYTSYSNLFYENKEIDEEGIDYLLKFLFYNIEYKTEEKFTSFKYVVNN